MEQKSKILSRLLTDASGAMIGLLVGLLSLQLLRDGISFPLDRSEWKVLISAVFCGLLLSSVFHRFFAQFLRPANNQN
jgi:uncharacterized protein YacL